MQFALLIRIVSHAAIAVLSHLLIEQVALCQDGLPINRTAFGARELKELGNSSLNLGYSLYRQGEWDKALSAFDKTIAAIPESPVGYAGRACVLIAQNKYNQGIEEMWRAIRRNPGDIANTYDPNAEPKRKLTAEALRHGEEQVKAMLRDRPAMAKYLTPDDKLWKWAVRKFAGEDIDAVVFWDPTDPEPRPAICEKKWDGRLVIQISPTSGDQNSRGFDDLWSSIVFELHNVAASNDAAAIADLVMRNLITRDDYILAVIATENQAAQRTRAFYLKSYLPWLRSQDGVATDPSHWNCLEFPPAGDRAALIEYWQADSRWQFYSAVYDLTCANREYELRNIDKARTILHSLQEHKSRLGATEIATMHYLLGCLCGLENNPEQAIEEFTKALAANPTLHLAALERAKRRSDLEQFSEAIDEFSKLLDVRALWPDVQIARAITYYNSGRFEKAIDDYDSAIQIKRSDPHLHHKRANAWYAKGDTARAFADYSEAIRLDPKYSDAYLGRAAALNKQRRFAEAIADLREAIRLDPDSAEAHHSLAQLLATCPDENLRDISEAIKSATKSCELTEWKDYRVVYMLAYALFRAERLEDAVKRMEQVVSLASAAGEPEAVQQELKERLSQFKRKARHVDR